MIRDEFYTKLLNDSGEIHFKRDEDGISMTWDGINPVFMTQQLFEDLDWERPEAEVLSHDTFRLCQYHFKHLKTYRQYSIIAFTVSPISEGMIGDYKSD